ncbi:hypothetical protein SFOMI_4493 [Sphingobium fuliginis]|uniref:Uncharacterized protein n=1 Tax=Sphingobium fuliginis (strain ATCC 27551) TaxID=336203 RepID=A0A292ZM49_SPHSA|nr:hypothetical protein SFOMI_4493 [Sphingobium fuliginis]
MRGLALFLSPPRRPRVGQRRSAVGRMRRRASQSGRCGAASAGWKHDHH